MRNINKIPPKIYLFLTVFSALIAMLIYRSTVFCCISFTSFEDSKAILWLIWTACLLTSYLLTFKRRRNYFSIFSNTVLPFGIYTMLTYDGVHLHLAFVLKTAILILCGLFGVLNLVWVNIPDDLNELLRVAKIRLIHFLNGAKSISVVFMSVLLIYVFALYAFDSPSLIPAVKPAVAVEANKAEVLEENMPVISKVSENIWNSLSSEEKLDVLQTLANVEKTQLGISHEVNVCADSLGLGTYGCYNYNSHTVYINKWILRESDSTECVKTICHELRHAYQHDSAEAYLSLDKKHQQLAIFDDLRDYYENLDDYKDVSDGFSEYENQTVEADSRAYSEERTSFYLNAADEYLAKAG